MTSPRNLEVLQWNAYARLQVVRRTFRCLGLCEHLILTSLAFYDILNSIPLDLWQWFRNLQAERVRHQGRRVLPVEQSLGIDQTPEQLLEETLERYTPKELVEINEELKTINRANSSEGNP